MAGECREHPVIRSPHFRDSPGRGNCRSEVVHLYFSSG
jgi:hypothetical protein